MLRASSESPRLTTPSLGSSIPTFPRFEPLQLEHLEVIHRFTLAFPPYSDFNATSLWTWSASGNFAVSQINGSLIVEFGDYLTGERYRSLLGDRALSSSIRMLLDDRRDGDPATLHLVPKPVAEAIADDGHIQLIPDRDAWDYVIDTKGLTECYGKLFAHARQACNNLNTFLGAHATDAFQTVDISWLAEHRSEVIGIFERWVDSGRDGTTSADGERRAIERFIRDAVELGKRFDLRMTLASVGDKFIGFAIFERVSDDWAIGHFMKGDSSIPGITTALLRQQARASYELGVRFLNIEQDLGIEGLRTAKTLLRPCSYLEKYTIRMRE